MKLFILAALIAVSSAARLEHLERGYLPPDQQGQFGRGQGHGSQGSNGHAHSNSFGSHGSNGFGSHGSNAVGSDDDSAGFGSAPQGSRTGPANFRGSASFDAAQSNQYLPPDHGPSGSHGFSRPNGGAQSQDAFGASSNQNQFGARPNSQYGAPQFGQNSNNGFGSQSSNGFGSQGSNSFGSHGSNGFGSHGSGSQGSNGFGSQGSNGFGSNARSQHAKGLRQYLAPKTSSSFDNIPQQAFDEETGYHY